MDQPPQANRRQYPRVRAEAFVVIRRVEGEIQVGRGHDLGIGGIRFQCLGPFDFGLGEAIEVTLALGEDSATVVGKTVRVTDKGQTREIALEFERLIDSEALERFCDLDEEEPLSDPRLSCKRRQDERRKYPRVRTAAHVLVRRVEGADPKLARGVDLGIGGIRFECGDDLDLELGEVVTATLTLGEISMTVVGKTVRVTDKGQTREVALEFERLIDSEELERLSEREQADESEGIPGSGNGDSEKSARSGPHGGQDA